MELLFEERESKGIVKDYYTQVSHISKNYREPPYVYKTLMDMAESDASLFSAVSLTVDLATYNGFTFLGKNEREIKEVTKLFNDKFDFDQVVDNVLWQLLIYGDAYLELRWDEEKTEIIELHPLESTEMVIDYDENGEVQKFMQKVANKTEKDWPVFETDEVIHFRLYWVGTQVYSLSPFKSIGRAFSTKVYANDYLSSIFRNLPPKIIYFLKNANDKQRKDLIENLIRAKTNSNMDIIAQGEAFETKLLQPTFDDGLIKVLEYLKKEVLMITRVPPHWVGMLDGANRGIGENVVIPYETKIKKIQQKIASSINKELMPKLGKPNVKFQWNAISLMDEKSIVDNMGSLDAQGFDSKTIIEYARDHGLKLRHAAKIEKLEDEGSVSKMRGGKTQIQDDTAPSRQRGNSKTDKMGAGVNKKGSSDAGAEKLEAKKVM